MKKRKKIIILTALITTLLLLVGVSFAYISYSVKQTSTNVIGTDCVRISLTDDTDAINLTDAYPLKDEEIENLKPYTFTITNSCNTAVNYKVDLDVLSTDKPTPTTDIAVKVDNNEKSILGNLPTTEKQIEESIEAREIYTGGVLNVGASRSHSILLWLDETASNDSQDTTHNSKIVVTATQNTNIEVKEVLANYTNETIYLSYKTFGSGAMSCKYGTEENNSNQTGTNVTNTSCELTGITPNSIYYYEVCLETSMGAKTCKNGSIDTEVPTLTLGNVTSTKDTITIPYTTNANNVTCRYGTSASDLTNEGTVSGSTCTINGLDESTRYYYEITATNELNRTTRVSGNIETKASLYTEEILAGNDPVIKEGLVPVTIGTNGAVKKADTSSEWYKYANKEWANAVILTPDAPSNISSGDTIEEQYIESYFVWIPKYDYKIQTLGVSTTGQEKAFEIRFSSQSTKDSVSGECTTPSADVASGTNYYSANCQVGDYMTHPAFIHFKDGIKGIWVGKFETGYKDAMTSTDESKAESNTANKDQVVVKPDIWSWRKIAASKTYITATTYKPSLNSHVMKNTEWGAVAYLTNSKYGRCSESGTCTEITTNSSNYRTGKTNGTRYFNGSVLASTTGNYTGIYDMSGGAVEFIMGYDDNVTSKSIFSSMPDLKYYDKYTSTSTSQDYSRRILGDATSETKKWFNNNSTTPYYGMVGFSRGGCWSCSGFGLFYFTQSNGSSGSSAETFRLVLVE